MVLKKRRAYFANKDIRLPGHLSSDHLPAWFPGAGWSMFPSIRPGDMVRICKGESPYQAGQVIVFFTQQKLIMHRIVGWDPLSSRWLVKGDTCSHFDPKLSDRHIVGYVSRVVRGRRIIEIGCDADKAELSLKLGTLAGKFFHSWPSGWARIPYLCFYLPGLACQKINTYLKRLSWGKH